ncbi:hypothetical protein DMN91_001447 [Ooceraea biroi]|uniref:Uncharacterized protein n=1 Tax=Ooceraea biroi TaxID=2015173 RepID=A0A3L8E5L6_OOCBI|nr:hypothetical protein DMN91_001447 [Ooceraea biroi]
MKPVNRMMNVRDVNLTGEGVGGAVGRQSVEVTGLWSRRDVAGVGRVGTPMEENGGVAAAGDKSRAVKEGSSSNLRRLELADYAMITRIWRALTTSASG